MVNMLPFIHNCQFCGFLLNNNNCIDRLSTLEWKANIQIGIYVTAALQVSRPLMLYGYMLFRIVHRLKNT